LLPGLDTSMVPPFLVDGGMLFVQSDSCCSARREWLACYGALIVCQTIVCQTIG
jgi:hypothetical protein